ncbi:MAG: hypothetical protein WCL02_07410 [bacterium]
MKFYVGSLQKPLLDILDQEKFTQTPGQIVTDTISDTKHITFIRHLESKYNEYKELIKSNPDYQEFMNIDNIPRKNNLFLQLLEFFFHKKGISRKKDLAHILLEDFFKDVGIDYET